ncbi:MAG: sterol desaturase family protein [Sphingomonadales bacterium]|nr:sterol desaturase family protein [Sphingomonadales bacterium]MBU3993480.1 sterol desaturase family protein [Alphaproteobacteria bacterium]
MIKDVLSYLDSSKLLHAPNYVVAAVLLLGACTIQLAYQVYRSRQFPHLLQLINHYFPFRGWLSKSALVDIGMYLMSRFVFRLVAISGDVLILLVAPAIIFAATFLGLPHANHSFGMIDIVICGIVLALLYDLGDFVAHYLMHRTPFLWEVHKVHHSATFLSPVTAFRSHPFEPYLYMLFHSLTVAPAVAAIGLIYDVKLVDILLLMWAANAVAFVLVLQDLKHSHVHLSFGILDRVFVSPHMHQLHHSAKFEHWDKNIGNIFSLWDWMAGTAVRQDTRIPVEYGIGRGRAADAEYLGFYGVYLRPVVNMARMTFAALTGRPSTRTEYPLPTEPEIVGGAGVAAVRTAWSVASAPDSSAPLATLRRKGEELPGPGGGDFASTGTSAAIAQSRIKDPA